jgi:hypothetical protein
MWARDCKELRNSTFPRSLSQPMTRIDLGLTLGGDEKLTTKVLVSKAQPGKISTCKFQLYPRN